MASGQDLPISCINVWLTLEVHLPEPIGQSEDAEVRVAAVNSEFMTQNIKNTEYSINITVARCLFHKNQYVFDVQYVVRYCHI